MVIAISSKNQALVTAVTEYFSSNDLKVVAYESLLNMLACLLEHNEPHNLILVDKIHYGMYKHFLLSFMRETRLKIPVVCIEPFKEKKKGCIVRWLFENEYEYGSSCQEVVPLLESLEFFLLKPKLQEIFQEYASEDEVEEIKITPALKEQRLLGHQPNLKSIRKNQKLNFNENLLSPSMKKLYRLFHKKIKTFVTISEIADTMGIASQNENVLKNSVYAYISRFKKKIIKIHGCYDVIRVDKGGYKLVLKK